MPIDRVEFTGSVVHFDPDSGREMTEIRLVTLAMFVFVFAVSAPAEPQKLPAPAEPKYIDDTAVYDQFFEKVEALAKAKKPLAHEKLIAKRKPRAGGIAPAKPGNKALSPEEVYKAAVQSV